MLNEYAGGLQQSFATVFERVGQSLQQSAQMMQMMNDVMEAALLQSLRVACRFDASTTELVVAVANGSQIALVDVALSVRLLNGDGSADLVFSTSFASLVPGDEHVVRVPLPRVAVAGEAELALRSPGTGAPLVKSTTFHVSLFESLAFQPVDREDVAANTLTAARTTSVDLQQLRRVLRLSPLDAMLTADAGSYRFSAAGVGADATVFYLSVSLGSGGEATHEVVIAAEHASQDPSEAARRACEALIKELEASAQPAASTSS